jgi:hypothetical protein
MKTTQRCLAGAGTSPVVRLPPSAPDKIPGVLYLHGRPAPPRDPKHAESLLRHPQSKTEWIGISCVTHEDIHLVAEAAAYVVD